MDQVNPGPLLQRPRRPPPPVGVDGADHEAKGDSARTRWMPAHGHCRYIRYWTAVRIRWHLAVTCAEKVKLAKIAAGCTNTVLRVR